MARRYPEFIEGETVVWKKTFYSDIERTTPVDPATVVFSLESPSGVVSAPTVSDEPGTGNYSAANIMDEYGLWDWRWETTNPNIADQGTINILQRNVPE